MEALRTHDSRIVHTDRLASPETAPRPGCSQARLRSLLDETALELRQAREDVEHQLAGRRGGVDGAVLQRPEADPQKYKPASPQDIMEASEFR